MVFCDLIFRLALKAFLSAITEILAKIGVLMMVSPFGGGKSRSALGEFSTLTLE